MIQDKKFTSSNLQQFAQSIFTKIGFSSEDATTIAQALIMANLRGVDTHGVNRIPLYLKFLKTGAMNPNPHIHIINDSPAVAVLEADRASGPVAMKVAQKIILEKAKATGIGLVMIRQTTHTAALGYYTNQLAQEGLISIAMTASKPLMNYFGAKGAGVSTAPISIAVPGPAHDPIVLDMSTGAISYGMLLQHKSLNQPIPSGLAQDDFGNPTTDPSKATIPMPLGGPKGSGLALMIELISAIAVSNPLIAEYFSNSPNAKRHSQNAWLLGIDTYRFCNKETFQKDVLATINGIKSLPVDMEVGVILAPGERGNRMRDRRLIEGVPIPEGVLQELGEIAAHFNIQMPVHIA